MPATIDLKINGVSHKVETDAQRTLLSVLRDDLDMTGCKYGCGEGQCGACTVLLNGKAARSCQIPVTSASEKEITTIEGLEKDGKLHPVQAAFIETGAMQCGYCTTGMILAVVALLSRNPEPSDEESRRSLEGNVCRCGTHPRILAAVQLAAKRMKEGSRQ